MLIKDNHLALGAELRPQAAGGYGPAEAVLKARQFLWERWGDAGRQMIVEIEVDTLEQLDEVLAVGPDLILLDNMGPATLREAVARRNAGSAAVELEASGGIDLGHGPRGGGNGRRKDQRGGPDACGRVARFRPGLELARNVVLNRGVGCLALPLLLN